MLKAPVQDIVAKISQRTGVSQDEINSKIDSKLAELSGLISRQGAAHIIANELGVNLYENVSGKIKLKDLSSGMKSIETVGKVQQIFELREFKTDLRHGKVASFSIGDETGFARVTLWNDQAEKIHGIKENDIVRIQNAYVRDNRGRKEVHLNDRSIMLLNPEGEHISEVKQYTTIRKKIAALQENDENIELLGTVVQVSEPKFFEVCPKCNKRARPHQDSFVCEEHDKVKPDYSYVINAILDDGTETVRVTYFRKQAEHLLSSTTEEIMQYKDNPAAFADARQQVLGKIVKVVGRVTKNTLFNRIEFVSQMVFPNPDPEEEIKRLEQELKMQQ